MKSRPTDKLKPAPSRKVRAVRTVADLTPDPKNANRGTARGADVVASSLRTFGAGRSVLADRRGVVIAGNKTAVAAAAAGMTDVIVVPTDGSKLVVVQRTDLDLERDTAAKQLAIADNRASQVGLEWDADALRQLRDDGIDLADAGFTLQEIEALVNVEVGSSDATGEAGEYSERYAVLVTCRNEAQQLALLDRLSAEGLECRALMS